MKEMTKTPQAPLVLPTDSEVKAQSGSAVNDTGSQQKPLEFTKRSSKFNDVETRIPLRPDKGGLNRKRRIALDLWRPFALLFIRFTICTLFEIGKAEDDSVHGDVLSGLNFS